MRSVAALPSLTTLQRDRRCEDLGMTPSIRCCARILTVPEEGGQRLDPAGVITGGR
jgi:hypothetical protein